MKGWRVDNVFEKYRSGSLSKKKVRKPKVVVNSIAAEIKPKERRSLKRKYNVSTWCQRSFAIFMMLLLIDRRNNGRIEGWTNIQKDTSKKMIFQEILHFF